LASISEKTLSLLLLSCQKFELKPLKIKNQLQNLPKTTKMHVLIRRINLVGKQLFSEHRVVVPSSSSSIRTFVNIGDKVPVNFVKDGKDPVILADKDYPEWVHTLADKLPSKNQLIQMVEDAGGVDADLTVLGEDNLRRAKRLITLDEIKKNNLLAASSV
jgi:hypothetical protein